MDKPRRRSHTRKDAMLPLPTALSSDWLVWSPPRTPIGYFELRLRGQFESRNSHASVQRDRYTKFARSLFSNNVTFIKISEEIEEFGYSSRFNRVTEKVSFKIWKSLTVINCDSDRLTFSIWTGLTENTPESFNFNTHCIIVIFISE